MKTREIVIYGILSAVLLAAQVSLGFLPNIEIVTLLILVYTLVFRKKVFFIIYIFVFLEGLIYGFGLWWINYLYVWSIQALITLLFRNDFRMVLEYPLRDLWYYIRSTLYHPLLCNRRDFRCICILDVRTSIRYHTLYQQFHCMSRIVQTDPLCFGEMYTADQIIFHT